MSSLPKFTREDLVQRQWHGDFKIEIHVYVYPIGSGNLNELTFSLAKNVIGLYKENTFYEQWHKTPWHRTKNMIFLDQFWRLFWIAFLSYSFRHQYVWFLAHLYVGLIPNSSSQLAELIFLYYSTSVDLYSHQILLWKSFWKTHEILSISSMSTDYTWRGYRQVSNIRRTLVDN